MVDQVDEHEAWSACSFWFLPVWLILAVKKVEISEVINAVLFNYSTHPQIDWSSGQERLSAASHFHSFRVFENANTFNNKNNNKCWLNDAFLLSLGLYKFRCLILKFFGVSGHKCYFLNVPFWNKGRKLVAIPPSSGTEGITCRWMRGRWDLCCSTTEVAVLEVSCLFRWMSGTLRCKGGSCEQCNKIKPENIILILAKTN